MWAVGIAIVLGNLTFWGCIVYVVIHFLAKIW